MTQKRKITLQPVARLIMLTGMILAFYLALPVLLSNNSSVTVYAAGAGGHFAVTCDKSGCDLVGKYINPLINFLSALFGLVAVASLIMGGINYASSEGDPQKSAQAKNRIYNTLIAIFAFFLLYAFLQFLIPGGLF